VAEAGARQVASAEVHGPLEAARDDHVSGSVGGYGHALVVTGAAEPLGPEVRTRGVVLHEEDVRESGAEQLAAAEVRSSRPRPDVARREDVAGRVRGDRIPLVVAESADGLRPDPGPGRRVLGEEN